MRRAWAEVFAEMFGILGDPVNDRGDPIDLFVIGARCTRTVFLRHPALTTHLGMAGRPSSDFSGAIVVMGAALEAAGLSGEQVGRAMYAYLSYVFGSIMLEASRRRDRPDGPDDAIGAPGYSIGTLAPDDVPHVDGATVEAIDELVVSNKEDDDAERLFLDAVRHLLRSYIELPVRVDHAG